MNSLSGTDRVVKTFRAGAFLRRCPWRFLTLYEFLHFEFPEPDLDADRFSGIGNPDFFVIQPNPARLGKFLVVTPTNTARLLQIGQLHRVDSRRICFCVAEPDSLTPADMQQIVATASDLNGLQVDLAVLTPDERRALRSMPIRSEDVGPWLDRIEAEEKRERRQ